MLSTVALVVAGLSTGHKIGLAAVGLAFIVFALISSFVLPRRNPDFPGKGLGWYVVVCVLFFVAMIGAVLVFDREPSEASARAATTAPRRRPPPRRTRRDDDRVRRDDRHDGSTTAQGDPAAGKTVFASAGCGGCHTLKAAGSTGNGRPEPRPAEAAARPDRAPGRERRRRRCRPSRAS